jgi:hypothetical protein
MLPSRTANPYAFGISTAGAAIDLPLPPAVPVVPGTLVKMVSESVAEAVASAVVGEAVEVVLYRLGSVAPQGWSTAQLVAHVLSVPQAFLHCTTNSWQMKYGSVNEYSVMLGCWLFPHRQPYCKVSYLAVSRVILRQQSIAGYTYGITCVHQCLLGRDLRADERAR